MAMKKEFGLGLVATGFPRIRKAKLINDLDQIANLTPLPLWFCSTGDYIPAQAVAGEGWTTISTRAWQTCNQLYLKAFLFCFFF